MKQEVEPVQGANGEPAIAVLDFHLLGRYAVAPIDAEVAGDIIKLNLVVDVHAAAGFDSSIIAVRLLGGGNSSRRYIRLSDAEDANRRSGIVVSTGLSPGNKRPSL